MRKVLRSTGDITSVSALAARIALYSGSLFVLLLGLLHIIEPEFTPTWRFVSEYQLGSYGWMMHLAFIALATSLAATGISLWHQTRNWLGYIGNIILWIAALGIFMAGIWTTDPIQTAKAAMTASGNLHVLGASLDYTPVAALLLTFSLIRTNEWKMLRVRLFITSGVTLLLMFAFIGVLPKDGVFGPEVYAGLVGRLLLVSYLGWIATIALRTLHLRTAQQK